MRTAAPDFLETLSTLLYSFDLQSNAVEGATPVGVLSTGKNAGSGMDRSEKKRLRERTGEHLNVSEARLTDEEALRLVNLIDNHDKYRGQSQTRTQRQEGWSSDGKYVLEHTFTDTFTEKVGIRSEHSYQDDDGETWESRTEISDALGVLNWLRDRR